MNSITFTDTASFDSAISSLEMTSTPAYVVERDNLTILTEDVDAIVDILIDDGIDGFSAHYGAEDEPFDGFRTDAEADADALASAGWGTDEDYGGSNDGGWDE